MEIDEPSKTEELLANNNINLQISLDNINDKKGKGNKNIIIEKKKKQLQKIIINFKIY